MCKRQISNDIAECIADVNDIERDEIDIHDKFSELINHQVHMVRVHQLLQSKWNFEIPLQGLMESGTIDEFASHVLANYLPERNYSGQLFIGK